MWKASSALRRISSLYENRPSLTFALDFHQRCPSSGDLQGQGALSPGLHTGAVDQVTGSAFRTTVDVICAADSLEQEKTVKLTPNNDCYENVVLIYVQLHINTTCTSLHLTNLFNSIQRHK